MLLSRHGVGTYQGNELTSNSSGHTRPQSSQLAESLGSDPVLKRRISVRELISTSKTEEKKKKKKKEREKKTNKKQANKNNNNKTKNNAGRERMVEHSPEILASEAKAITTTTTTTTTIIGDSWFKRKKNPDS